MHSYSVSLSDSLYQFHAWEKWLLRSKVQISSAFAPYLDTQWSNPKVIAFHTTLSNTMYNIRENLDSEMQLKLPFQESFSPALFLFFFLAVILGNVKNCEKQSAEKSRNSTL